MLSRITVAVVTIAIIGIGGMVLLSHLATKTNELGRVSVDMVNQLRVAGYKVWVFNRVVNKVKNYNATTAAACLLETVAILILAMVRRTIEIKKLV